MVNGQFRLVGINIQYQEVLIIGVAVAVAIALRLLFYSTRTGVLSGPWSTTPSCWPCPGSPRTG